MPSIGPYALSSPILLAPMAGITDRPFRRLCHGFGAALTVAEMLTDDTRLWSSRKSRLRLIHRDDPEPRSVQIIGTEPATLAQAAQANVEMGAQIIDINMGCPAKKVCQKAAGSALLRDPELVERILRTVVAAVEVPVTLKIRTGWSPQERNAVEIAQLAEDCGIQALAIHGRTRSDLFRGEAEYDTIAAVKQAVSIPVWANGDIDSPEKAEAVLRHTGADGLLIGRAVQGRPWIFREIRHYLETGERLESPSGPELHTIILTHLNALHDFYGESLGVRIARKHLGWYFQNFPEGRAFCRQFNSLSSTSAQIETLGLFFAQGGRYSPDSALPQRATASSVMGSVQ